MLLSFLDLKVLFQVGKFIMYLCCSNFGVLKGKNYLFLCIKGQSFHRLLFDLDLASHWEFSAI